MAELSHFAWPFQLGADLEQDTPQELSASAAVILCTPRGERDDDPHFGVTAPVFDTQPIDTVRLARELAQSDPRLDPDVSEVLDLADATRAAIRVGVNGA